MPEETIPVTENTPKEKKGIPGSTLKLIAIITMFIDHTAASVLDCFLVSKGLYNISSSEESLAFLSKYGAVYYIDMTMRVIGRLAFPIFCFLLVEGFMHTRNVWKYLRNLAIFSVISEVPFDLAFYQTAWDTSYQNVYFTLALGLLALIGIRAASQKEHWKLLSTAFGYPAFFLAGPMTVYIIYECLSSNSFIDLGNEFRPFTQTYLLISIVAGVISMCALLVMFRVKSDDEKTSVAYGLYSAMACMLAAALLSTDYGAAGVFVIVLMYLFKDKGYVKEGIAGCVMLTCLQGIECSSFFILIPLRRYNGERGFSLKYFFYVFYPAHLLILYLVCVLLKIA